MIELQDTTYARHEALGRVLGIEPGLDRMAIGPDIALREILEDKIGWDVPELEIDFLFAQDDRGALHPGAGLEAD